MKTRARLEGDNWVLNGTRAWITNSGVSEWYTVMAVTGPAKKANGVSAFVVHRDDPGLADRIIGAPGTGFKTALRTLDFTRPTIGAQAFGVAQGALDASVAHVKERTRFGRASAASRACSSCSPTWR